ncbi:hypothetical protein BBJ28_00017078 [Nothophytophthora sp. Chile5]|nr:hypothetical protein BBJ28_00017078 [Nothophytophthora sp. Chile5]
MEGMASVLGPQELYVHIKTQGKPPQRRHRKPVKLTRRIMLKRLSERFPAAATRLEAYTGSASHGTEDAPPSAAADAAASPSPAQEQRDDNPSSPTLFGEEPPTSEEHQTASLKAALAERFNSESMSAAATSMMGFMKKAQTVASSAAREGAVKATVWKNRALDAADMDALQRRLSYALDRSTGEVNLDLLNFSYITENIVAMGFPNMNLGTNRTLLKDNPIDLVAMYLNEKHGGHYMIWNLSEEAYDYAYFDNQVLEFNFPGHPAPPLGMYADEKNLAAIHCLTGKGRTGTVIACYLAWVGRFPNAMESLEYVAEQRQTSVEKLTIPSQRRYRSSLCVAGIARVLMDVPPFLSLSTCRYIQYFNNVMDGVKPGSSPLLLRRVIINTIPVFGERRVLEPAKKESTDGSETVGEDGESLTAPVDEGEALGEIVEQGCCPYLQIFKAGKLVFTTTWRDMEDGNGIQWANTNDGSVSFNVNCMLQGDILIRCRHLTDAGERVSMFRGAFHTGYDPTLVGAVALVLHVQLHGVALLPLTDYTLVLADGDAVKAPKSEGVALNEEDRQAYEDMLHRDEAFWADIEDRKKRLQKQREEQLKKKQAEAEAAAAAAEAAAVEAAKQAELAKRQAAKAQNSFSIGGGDEDAAFSEKKAANRKGSWDEEKDKELMSELESLTSGAKTKVADGSASLFQNSLEEKAADPTKASSGKDESADLSKEFDEMKNLEKELGLQSFTDDLANLPDGKVDPQLELLDAELKGLGGLSPKAGDATGDDVMNFGADDFDELEEYLSGLSGSSK